MSRTAFLADALVDLARVALTLGKVDRAVYHPDQTTPESDTDHTVMLGWAAPSVAAAWFPQLDVGLVAQFALVHDAAEAYAGDTPTLQITAAGRAAKAAREAAAVAQLGAEFDSRLPWLPATLREYERQLLPEARFVRVVDKVLPKLVNLLEGCHSLIEQGVSPAELVEAWAGQRQEISGYVGEFGPLLSLFDEAVTRVLEYPTVAVAAEAAGHGGWPYLVDEVEPDEVGALVETARATGVIGEVSAAPGDLLARPKHAHLPLDEVGVARGRVAAGRGEQR